MQWAWRVVSARRPVDDEVQILKKVLAGHRARFAKDMESAKKLIAYGESKADESLKPDELASWTLVANLLLNLDEVVNKN